MYCWVTLEQKYKDSVVEKAIYVCHMLIF